jgi:uncharacterized membrane protein HdeD (DUF308 family)
MAQRWTRQLAGAHGAPGAHGSQIGGFGGWILGVELTGEELRRARKLLTVGGILALIAGLVAIVVPVIASVTIALFIGWVMVAGGITMAIQAVSNRAPLRALEALLTLIAGLYVVIFPLNGTVTLTFVLSVWLFATGVLSLLAASRLGRTPQAWSAGIGGVLSVILGFLIADSLPSSAAWAIGLLVGIDLIFWGVRALVAARLLGQAVQER